MLVDMPDPIPTAATARAGVVLDDAEAAALEQLATFPGDRDLVEAAAALLLERVSDRIEDRDRDGARALWWAADVALARIGQRAQLTEGPDALMTFGSGEQLLALGYDVEMARAELASGVVHSRNQAQIIERAARLVNPQAAVDLALELAGGAHRLGDSVLEREYLAGARGSLESWPRLHQPMQRRFVRAEVFFHLARTEFASGDKDYAYQLALDAWSSGRGSPNPSRDAGLALIIASGHEQRGHSRRAAHWRARSRSIRKAAHAWAHSDLDRRVGDHQLETIANDALARHDHMAAISALRELAKRQEGPSALANDEDRGRVRALHMRALREGGEPDAAIRLHEHAATQRPTLRTWGDLAIERGLAERDLRGPQAAEARAWFEFAGYAYADADHRSGVVLAESLLRIRERATRSDVSRQR